jgi:tRNA(fMet)-specific endonuclease VapC
MESNRSKPIGSMDAMIAGHAIAVQATLVSNNGRRFNWVAALKTENWTRAESGS